MSLGTSQFQVGAYFHEIRGSKVVAFLVDSPILRGWARVGSDTPSPKSLCQMGGHIYGSARLGLTGAGRRLYGACVMHISYYRRFYRNLRKKLPHGMAHN